MAAPKKIPLRKCLVCGEMRPKKELIRITRSPEGEVFADPTGKKAGRGGYICRSADCIERARKTKRLEKAFSCAVDSTVYDEAEKLLLNEADGK